MVQRRAVLGWMVAGAVWAAVPGVAQASPEGWLATAFRALPLADRVKVQEAVARLEIYAGPLDGVPSAETDKALAELPARITAVTADGVSVVLESPEDGVRFLRELAQGAWDPFLFEGWSENAQPRD